MSQYIVTLKTHDDLDDFYGDMEGSSGTDNIPSRQCECLSRKPISRCTLYDLTDDEASKLKNDSRVRAVENPLSDDIVDGLCGWTQTGNFEKSGTSIESDDKDWGLFRTENGATSSGWGSDGTTEITRTINTTSSGKNVDVVIIDAHMNFDHPEFTLNPDGSGGSRAKQYNWFQWNYLMGSAIENSWPSTYIYDSTTDNTNLEESHGTHVAGIACGNTQGWARDANIYNMSFSTTGWGQDPTTDGYGISWSLHMWDYIRMFHKNKPINPETGRRNPTICNNSWGRYYNFRNPITTPTTYGANVYISEITSVTYRGTTTAVTGTTQQRRAILEANGIPVHFSSAGVILGIPARNAYLDSECEDCIADGIIMVGASGNEGIPITRDDSDADWDNSFTFFNAGSQQSTVYYPYRGKTPTSCDGHICVGAIESTVGEYKTFFSNYDKRVDVWAAGQQIISSVGTPRDPYGNVSAYAVSANDSRNSESNNNYKISSISGTSMASPQVTGYLACLLEQEPNLTPAEALQHLIEISKNNVADAGASNPNTYPFETLGNSPNRWLFYQKKRPVYGVAYPSTIKKNRNPTTNGVKYPRSSSLVTKTS